MRDALRDLPAGERLNMATANQLVTDMEMHTLGTCRGKDNVVLAIAGSNITSAFETLLQPGLGLA